MEKIHFPIPQNYFFLAFKTKNSILSYYNIINVIYVQRKYKEIYISLFKRNLSN